MPIPPPPPSPALAAYEQLAPHFDAFTAAYDYERWLEVLERLLLAHGLAGRTVLDVACGSGSSFLPLARRGYEITACDVSPAMVELARAKARGLAARIVVADMRALPRLGAFDAATCLGDSVNYLLDAGELRAFVAGAAANLRTGGLLAFDVNTLATYRSAFVADRVVEDPARLICWRGVGSAELAPGGLSRAHVDAFARAPGEVWLRSSSEHVQRHHPHDDVVDALEAAGMELVAHRGQSPGAVLHPEVDELRHHKALYVARLG